MEKLLEHKILCTRCARNYEPPEAFFDASDPDRPDPDEPSALICPMISELTYAGQRRLLRNELFPVVCSDCGICVYASASANWFLTLLTRRQGWDEGSGSQDGA